VIPPHISEFLQVFIKSVWALDLLRLMKNAPERLWTVTELTGELRGSVPMVESILDGFLRAGLTVEDPAAQYRYAAPPALDGLIAELLVLYSQRPVAVINEIAHTSPERTSTDKIRSFVDAFRLKKD
jgi:hypothetical protein